MNQTQKLIPLEVSSYVEVVLPLLDRTIDSKHIFSKINGMGE